jgi:hypothetical protein
VTKRASPSKKAFSHHPDAALDMISAWVILCVAVQVCLSFTCTGGVSHLWRMKSSYILHAFPATSTLIEDCI